MELRKEDVAIVEAVAKEQAHYSLNNVRVEPGRLIATDGRILVLRDVHMEEDEEPFDPFVLDGKALRAAAGKGAFLRLGENDTVKIRAATYTNGTLVPNRTETTLAKDDSSYPEYERVIPPETREGQKTVLLDVANLIRILKAFRGVEYVRVSILDGDEPVRFDAKMLGDRKIVGVQMPMVNS